MRGVLEAGLWDGFGGFWGGFMEGRGGFEGGVLEGGLSDGFVRGFMVVLVGFWRRVYGRGRGVLGRIMGSFWRGLYGSFGGFLGYGLKEGRGGFGWFC